jgi:1-pyrroline-5-carboxylate dehydrogenase
VVSRRSQSFLETVSELGAVALAHRDLAALNFTGSTATFNHIQRTVGANASHYRGYPRVVGETGALAFACVRSAFEYLGQKVRFGVAPTAPSL